MMFLSKAKIVAAILTIGVSTVAHAAKEIELKFQLDAENMTRFTTWLGANTAFKGEVRQEETYLDNPAATFTAPSARGFNDALTSMRVRKTSEGTTWCLKKRTIDATGKTLSRNEFETTVGGADEALSILKALGFTREIRVFKTRKAYDYADDAGVAYEVVIDEVDDLGTFVEIELKNGSDDTAAGLKLIEQVIKSVGITQYTRFDRSYIHMQMNPDWKAHPEWKFAEEITVS
jgi:predicted adenylyl cyclase CyaB